MPPSVSGTDESSTQTCPQRTVVDSTLARGTQNAPSPVTGRLKQTCVYVHNRCIRLETWMLPPGCGARCRCLITQPKHETRLRIDNAAAKQYPSAYATLKIALHAVAWNTEVACLSRAKSWAARLWLRETAFVRRITCALICGHQSSFQALSSHAIST
jgi:hypothetical protein